MTARENKIAKAILDYLHRLEEGQAHKLTIHAEIGGMLFCSGTELDEVLGHLDTKRWVSYYKSPTKGLLWNITDLGEGNRTRL